MSHHSSTEIAAKDVVSVGSRISWSTLLAGAVVSLAVYFALGVFGTAVGLTSAPKLEQDQLVVGAALWGGVSLLIALFLGGWVVTRTTVREDKMESLIFGVVLWGVLLLSVMGLAAVGVGIGFGPTLLHAASSGAEPSTAGAVESLTTALGLTEEQVRSLEQAVAGEGDSVDATTASWWAFGVMALSLFVTILGCVCGAGPDLVMRQLRGRRLGLGVATSS